MSELEDAEAGIVERALSEVRADDAWALVEAFSDLVRESGSEDERRAAEWIVERLQGFGLEPLVHEPELYLSVPRRATLTVLAPEAGEPVACKTPAFSRSTGAEGLEGELVRVASDRVTDTQALFTAGARVDPEKVAGRIVLADGYAMPKIVREIGSAGAAGAVFVNPGHAHEGIVTPIWGTPGLEDRGRIPDLPVVNVPRDVGEGLYELAERGACRVRLETELFRGWAACPLVEVRIPGATPDFVLIHGHYDSWHVGIGDNAVGDGALLEVARVAGRFSDELQRGVRVVWWPGHSTARYGGSTWYADTFAMQLRNHCVAQIDVDSPGCRWATAYDEVMWMAEAGAFAASAIERIAGIQPGGARPLRAGDYSFNNIGLTGFYMLLSNIPEDGREAKGFYPVGGCGGNSDAWHTEGDTLEVADRDNLERDIRVYVDAVVRLATVPLVPFDYRATVEEIAAAARDYAEAAEGAFDVGPVEECCAALLDDLDRFYARAGRLVESSGGRDAGESGTTAQADLRAIDRVQLALARELVPINYSSERRYYHDPATEVPCLPDLAVLRRWAELEGDEDGRAFLLAQALRGRNRVVDALLRGRERVRSVLPQEGR